MTNDISPEERLLRLIRNPKKPNIQEASIEAQKNPLLASAKPEPAPMPSGQPLVKKYFSFAYVQKIISVIFIISGIYFMVSFIYPFLVFQEKDSSSLTRGIIADARTELKNQDVRPFEFYLEAVKGKKIFGTLSLPKAPEKDKAAVEASADFIRDMNLLGIISGENPEAIIEDKKAGKTYYVTKGKFIGEFQVEDIQEGRVTLKYQERSYELYL